MNGGRFRIAKVFALLAVFWGALFLAACGEKPLEAQVGDACAAALEAEGFGEVVYLDDQVRDAQAHVRYEIESEIGGGAAVVKLRPSGLEYLARGAIVHCWVKILDGSVPQDNPVTRIAWDNESRGDLCNQAGNPCRGTAE